MAGLHYSPDAANYLPIGYALWLVLTRALSFRRSSRPGLGGRRVFGLWSSRAEAATTSAELKPLTWGGADDMDKPLLNDQNEYPDDEVLAKHLGKAKPVWDAFAAAIADEFGAAALEWRYYNDGKAWLCKFVHKKKTVCWVSIWSRFFKTTFYFTAKNDRDVEALPIASDLKDAYRAHVPIGKLKPLTVEVGTKKALQNVLVLVKYKSSLK
jgi:hypothetical protein